MKTSDILKKCAEIPGVALKKNSRNMELTLEQPRWQRRNNVLQPFPGNPACFYPCQFSCMART